jgi:hypothetical protein
MFTYVSLVYLMHLETRVIVHRDNGCGTFLGYVGTRDLRRVRGLEI